MASAVPSNAWRSNQLCFPSVRATITVVRHSPSRARRVRTILITVGAAVAHARAGETQMFSGLSLRSLGSFKKSSLALRAMDLSRFFQYPYS